MSTSQSLFSDKKIRAVSTTDIDELATFQLNKNRRYTQLQTGKFNGQYLEVNLGDVQVFRESLVVGSLIEAAPISAFVPFAAVLSNADDFKFCGKQREKNTILQATGGFWDACFKDNLSFVVAAFNRNAFASNIQRLTGEEVPTEWFISKACHADPIALDKYAKGLDNIITMVQDRPEILSTENSKRMLSDSIFILIFDVLKSTREYTCKQVHRSVRLKGVRRVIDYLHAYSAQLPTIAELCKVAHLSERNLQYGFKEYLGITPISYLRLIRLNGVRRDLLLSHPQQERVVDIALNWGFIELGRFAGEYKRLFQELPSVTLKSLNKAV